MQKGHRSLDADFPTPLEEASPVHLFRCGSPPTPPTLGSRSIISYPVCKKYCFPPPSYVALGREKKGPSQPPHLLSHFLPLLWLAKKDDGQFGSGRRVGHRGKNAILSPKCGKFGRIYPMRVSPRKYLVRSNLNKKIPRNFLFPVIPKKIYHNFFPEKGKRETFVGKAVRLCFRKAYTYSAAISKKLLQFGAVRVS